nr:hypothetical protein Beed-S103_00007 [Bovine alphaherpesvirus 5]
MPTATAGGRGPGAPPELICDIIMAYPPGAAALMFRLTSRL